MQSIEEKILEVQKNINKIRNQTNNLITIPDCPNYYLFARTAESPTLPSQVDAHNGDDSILSDESEVSSPVSSGAYLSRREFETTSQLIEKSTNTVQTDEEQLMPTGRMSRPISQESDRALSRRDLETTGNFVEQSTNTMKIQEEQLTPTRTRITPVPQEYTIRAVTPELITMTQQIDRLKFENSVIETEQAQKLNQLRTSVDSLCITNRSTSPQRQTVKNDAETEELKSMVFQLMNTVNERKQYEENLRQEIMDLKSQNVMNELEGIRKQQMFENKMETKIKEMNTLKKKIKKAENQRQEHGPYLDLLDAARLETLRRSDSLSNHEMQATQKFARPPSGLTNSSNGTESKLRQLVTKRKNLEDKIIQLNTYKSKVRANVRRN